MREVSARERRILIGIEDLGLSESFAKRVYLEPGRQRVRQTPRQNPPRRGGGIPYAPVGPAAM